MVKSGSEEFGTEWWDGDEVWVREPDNIILGL